MNRVPGPYPYLWLDALTQKVREDGRIVNAGVVVATAGKGEIVGMDVGTSEDGIFWLAFLRSLSARGLSRVELVVSDAHQGLRGASWQRCRTHFITNLLTRVPRHAQPWVATMVRTIHQQPSPYEVHAQLDRVTEQLQDTSRERRKQSQVGVPPAGRPSGPGNLPRLRWPFPGGFEHAIDGVPTRRTGWPPPARPPSIRPSPAGAPVQSLSQSRRG